jgi:hypothetical protein
VLPAPSSCSVRTFKLPTRVALCTSVTLSLCCGIVAPTAGAQIQWLAAKLQLLHKLCRIQVAVSIQTAHSTHLCGPSCIHPSYAQSCVHTVVKRPHPLPEQSHPLPPSPPSPLAPAPPASKHFPVLKVSCSSPVSFSLQR